MNLTGEDSDHPIGADDPWQFPAKPGIAFDLSFRDVRWQLSSGAVDFFGPKTSATLADTRQELLSPCLLVGENGEGKSMLARLLARSLAFKGSVHLNPDLDKRPIHLLFQDVIAQTLLRSFRQIAGVSSKANSETSQVLATYRRLGLWVDRFLDGSVSLDAPYRSEAFYPTLLQTKLLLTAVRLCRNPGLLILDEPDWGLSRAQAIAFLAATLRTAHDLEIPLMLISHKPWWLSIARSCLRISKELSYGKGDNNPQLHFRLHTVAVGEPKA
jgi:ABC-type branched-subunit amino acid transport system ATPase component